MTKGDDQIWIGSRPMKEYITQEQATGLATDLDKNWTGNNGDELCAALCNAAIQHYLSEQAKELPVLPDLYELLRKGYWQEDDDCYFICLTKSDAADLATEIEPAIHKYGADCAVHAREVALSEAQQIARRGLGAMITERDALSQIEQLKAGE